MLHPNTKKGLTETLQAWFKRFSQSFHAIKVGKITGVNYNNQTVDVQVLHKMRDDIDPRANKLFDYPLLTQVPFVVLCGGDSRLTFPIKKGDNCLLLFCDYEIDRWWDTGEPLPATYERRHNISDAFALVGVHSMVDLIQGYSNYVRLQYSDVSGITIGNEITLQNMQVVATGDVNAAGTVTGAQLVAENGYSGVVTCGTQLLSFANGILISVE